MAAGFAADATHLTWINVQPALSGEYERASEGFGLMRHHPPRFCTPYRSFCAVLLTGLLVLAACATGPAYKPKGPGEIVGYADEQLAANRYRVTFSGGTGTRREQVEDYLLRRAAEVTVQAGYAYFKFDTRSMEATTYYRATFDTWGPRFGPRFGPRPWYGPGLHPWYWSSWPYPSMWAGDVIPVTRYTAYSEIVMLTPEQAMNDANAISAREVLDRLVPVEPARRSPAA